MRVLCTVIVLGGFLVGQGCTPTSFLRSKGPTVVRSAAVSKPASSRKRIPCEKEANPKPVRFSCKAAVLISIKLDRLAAWPAKCKRKIAVAEKKAAVTCAGKLKKKKIRNDALRKKNKILTQQLGRVAPKVTAYVAGGVIGLMAGIAIGVLGAVMIYQFSPKQQGVVFP